MSRIPPQIEQSLDDIAGDRNAPNKLYPITENGITYTVLRERLENDKGGYTSQEMYLEATRADGSALWKTHFFHAPFDQDLEIDVQEIYPVDLGFDGPWVVVKLENYTDNDRIFRIAKEDGTLALKS